MPMTGVDEDLAPLRPVVLAGEVCNTQSLKSFMEDMGDRYWMHRGWVCLSTQYLQSVGLTNYTEGDTWT